MIAFDPGDVDEKVLSDNAIKAATEGKQTLTVTVNGTPMSLKVADLLQIVPDIDGQIYARDFMLVRQSDMIVSYIPELPGASGQPGKPGLSSGVERELQHAHEHAKDVYVIWKPKKEPSPSSPKPPTKSSAPPTKPSPSSIKKATSNPTAFSAADPSSPRPHRQRFSQLIVDRRSTHITKNEATEAAQTPHEMAVTFFNPGG